MSTVIEQAIITFMIIYNCNFENWSAKVSLKYENIIKKHSYQFQTANFLLKISFSACIIDQVISYRH